MQQFGIVTPSLYELLMRSLFDQPTVLQNKNGISIADRV
jgi:hypothetical protein